MLITSLSARLRRTTSPYSRRRQLQAPEVPIVCSQTRLLIDECEAKRNKGKATKIMAPVD